ncbi:MAG: PQQ-binding-like beta-propeller repeat protein [Candidatus Hinthialibacter antarcticus]|nr:PQQ-binding-like beta-propeller repeat protein [Candidatus Hinthialibacter antarcticus]
MKRRFLAITLFAIAVQFISVQAEDWPTYRKDNSRSGVTSEALQAPLSLEWLHQAKHAPKPAWPGPARRDGWHKVDNLKPRVIFDWAYHIVAADGKVFYGSSADDKVYCIDANSGEELWSFFTDAPVRLAPSYENGKLYVGSDDGNAYCLNADNGELIWKKKPSSLDFRVSGHNRMMSLWPVRSGVLVDNGEAYFCAGLFPVEGVYVTAHNAENGDEVWTKKVENIPPQGYLLASDNKLYVPTGRGTPAVFDRKSGDYMYSLGGSGGSFALLTGDMLVYGPGKTGELDAFAEESESSDQVASFSGNHMVVTPERTFLHTDTEMSAIDRQRHTQLLAERRELEQQKKELTAKMKKLGRDLGGEEGLKIKGDLESTMIRLGQIPKELEECMLWKKECKYPYSLILAGDLLFAGGSGSVAAFSAKDGSEVWSQEVDGRALEIAVADGRLLVSTDKGLVYAFNSQSEEK